MARVDREKVLLTGEYISGDDLFAVAPTRREKYTDALLNTGGSGFIASHVLDLLLAQELVIVTDS